MGLSDYGILQRPFVALLPGQSLRGIASARAGVQFGIIDSVNPYNINAVPGDSFMFNETNSMLINAYGTQYLIIDEENLVYKENPLT